VNANQVFYWRKKYREGRLGENQSSKLLPVTLSDIAWSKSDRADCAFSPLAVGSMEIKLAKGILRVAGNVDVVALRTAIECLVG
jgi:transposase-like protein